MDEVFSSSRVYPKVEIFGICVPFLQVFHPSTLFSPSPFQSGEADNPFFQPGPQVGFFQRELTNILCHVEVQNDMQSHMELNFCIGEQPLAPAFEPESCLAKLVK